MIYFAQAYLVRGEDVDALAALVSEIPGVYEGRWGIRVAYDAGPAVAQVAQRNGLSRLEWDWPDPHRRPPGPMTDRQQEALVRRVLKSPHVRDWIVTGTGGLGWSYVPYQWEFLSYLTHCGGGFLKARGGAGKTAIAATWGALGDGPIVAVTKGSVAPQLAEEFEQILVTEVLELDRPSSLPVRNKVRMTPREYLAEYVEQAQDKGVLPVIVCGWPRLRLWVEEIIRYPWTSVIFDESQFAASPDRRNFWKDGEDSWQSEWSRTATGRTYTLSASAGILADHVPRRLAMTATPTHTDRSVLWGQFSLVAPKWFGATWSKFRIRYCGAIPGEHGGLEDTMPTNSDELRSRMDHFFFAIPDAVVDSQLPALSVQARFVTRKRQDKPAPGFKRERKKLARAATRGDASALGLLRELDIQEAATRKRTAALSLVQTEVDRGADEDDPSKGKVIVFTGRQRDCHALANRIEKRTKVEVFRGVVKEGKDYQLVAGKDRFALQKAYMAHPGPCVLVATALAWGTGTNLQDTDLLLLAMIPRGPGEFEQQITRVHRLGMDRQTKVVILVAEGTIDEREVRRVLEKSADAMDTTQQESLGRVVDALLEEDKGWFPLWERLRRGFKDPWTA